MLFVVAYLNLYFCYIILLMKRIFILAALLISFSGFSQSFTLNELIKLSKVSDSYFDTYVTKKGFIYNDRGDEEQTTYTEYAFQTKSNTTRFITKIDYKFINKTMITFRTQDANTYLSTKENLKKLGFSFIRKGDYDGGIFFEYNKKNTTVALMTDTKTNSHLDYEITVEYNYE
jgi:hypothetical protein